MNLYVTEKARKALIKGASKSTWINNPVATIVWTTDLDGSRGGWRVGYYDRNKVSDDWIIKISDMEFVIDPIWREKLDGMTLDFFDGYYQVNPRPSKGL